MCAMTLRERAETGQARAFILTPHRGWPQPSSLADWGARSYLAGSDRFNLAAKFDAASPAAVWARRADVNAQKPLATRAVRC